MYPQCGAELERIPTGTPGCYDVYCTDDRGYIVHQITIDGLETDDPSNDYHPLVDGRRAGYGDEEVATCDECGRAFLAAEVSHSKWSGKPICPPCERLQKESEQ